MAIMGCRYEMLVNAYHGLVNTGLPLVAQHGAALRPAGFSDDLGSYYFIPLIAKSAGLSLHASIYVFYWTLISLGLLLSMIVNLRIFPGKHTRVLTCAIHMILFLMCINIFDVYVLPIVAVTLIVPLCTLLYIRRPKPRVTLIFMAAAGLIIGYANIIRAQSGTGVAVFVICILILSPHIKVTHKLSNSALLILCIFVAYVHFGKLDFERKAFLCENPKVLDANTESNFRASYYCHGFNPHDQSFLHFCTTRHPFWHSVYIGLGYLGTNNMGISYDDSVAMQTVKKDDPAAVYLSKTYENILRHKVLRIATKSPLFLVMELFMKSMMLLGYFIFFSCPGILFWNKKMNHRPLLVAYAAMISFYSLPGLLVAPIIAYVSGMICSSMLFGLTLFGLSREPHLPAS